MFLFFQFLKFLRQLNNLRKHCQKFDQIYLLTAILALWGRTHGQTDGRTDKAAYRDSLTHLKTALSAKPIEEKSLGRTKPLFNRAHILGQLKLLCFD